MQLTLKLATSLDGKIALANGESQWITCQDSRSYGHILRAEQDAIVVGANTAAADDPLLTSRTVPLPDKQPIRMVLDTKARLSPESRLANTTHIGRVVIVTGNAVDEANLALLKAKGVEHWTCGASTPNQSVDINLFYDWAQSTGLKSILIEGGGKLAASFLKLGLIDRIEWFVAPIIIGGDGIPAISDLNLSAIADAPNWQVAQHQVLGQDSHTTYVAS